ncbi:hypothetical protein AALO_G00239290 [Alosa alosa]|uniref:THAP domain-containing protein 1 n=1 Tax=Alosa alosa TaxID=278164 RepID=A0AAV6FW21_9TELE|nr:hypothetical protein AALO_G00239290 [Alosa alosa]
MVCTCMVPGCLASTRKIHGVHFHRLPKELELCKKWLRAINNPKFGQDTAIEALKHLTVCSLHFKAEDFEPNPLGVKRPALVKTELRLIFTLPDDVDEQPGTSETSSASCTKRICLESPCPSTPGLDTSASTLEVGETDERHYKTAEEQKKRMWLKKDSVAYQDLTSLVFDKRLLKDLQKMALFQHTGPLEIFHRGAGFRECPITPHHQYWCSQSEGPLTSSG